MSTDRPDRTIRAWLDLMPDVAPDRVIETVLQAVDETPQARRPLGLGPWRFRHMNRLALIAAAALLGAAVLGGAALIGSRPNDQPAPTQLAVAPSVAPSAGPVQTAAPQTQLSGAPTRLRKAWTADVPAIAALGFVGGPVTLTIDGTGLQLASSPVGTGGSVISSIDLLNYRYRLNLLDAFGTCPAGSLGLYQGIEGASASSLEFVEISEPCAARAELLVRTWLPATPGG